MYMHVVNLSLCFVITAGDLLSRSRSPTTTFCAVLVTVSVFLYCEHVCCVVPFVVAINKIDKPEADVVSMQFAVTSW